MTIKEAIDQLEDLKMDRELFKFDDIARADAEALRIAITVLKLHINERGE